MAQLDSRFQGKSIQSEKLFIQSQQQALHQRRPVQFHHPPHVF